MNALQGEGSAADRRDLGVEYRRRFPAAPAQGGGEGPVDLDLGALAALVWRQKFTVALFGVAFGLLAMALVYAVTPRYKADAVVMLDRTEEQIIDLESVVTGMTPDYYSILAEAEVLRSRKLAGRVVDELNLTQNPVFNHDLVEPSEPPLPLALVFGAVEMLKDMVRGAVTERETPGREELLEPDYFVRQRTIDRLLDRQSVSSIENTYVYRIVLETEDPILSTEIANAFADLYITDQLEKKFEATQAATKWLSERVAQLKIDLEESEAAVEAYNASTTLISEESLAAGSRQVKELRERRAELLATAEAASQRLAQLEQAVEAGDAAAAAEAARDPRFEDLLTAAEALPAGADGRSREAIALRIQNATDRAVATLRVEKERADRQLAGIDSSIEQLEANLAEQSEDLVQLRQLQREAEANRRIYEQFLRRLNETSVQQGVQQADARLLSPAVIDFNPSYPNKMLSVLAAGILGGLVGVAFVVLLDRTNRAYRSAEELEQATGLAVLGSIPAAPVRRRRDLLTYARERGSSQLMEAVRNLRTGVLLANVDSQPKVVMLTSSLPKEGKTTSSLLLAQNAAALGKRTLLIECDLRRRTFRSYFEIEGENGLLSVLTGEKSRDEVVHHDAEIGLDVIPGQESKVNAADVFSSQRFAEFIASVREDYDFVVIDTPPVLAVPDARVIAPLADAVIYCVRWNTTHRDLVRNGIAAFTQIGVRVTGLAMTQVNLRKLARYGYGGYDYYYYRTSKRYYVN